MSILKIRTVGVMALISVFSLIADADARSKRAPNSLYEILGVKNRSMSSGEGMMSTMAAPTSGILESTLSRQVYASAASDCPTVPQYPTWLTIYDKPIVTQNLASTTPNVVEVNFNIQASIAPGGIPTDADAIFLSCTASYSSGGSVACSSTEQFPALLRQGQATNESGHLSMVSYQGYVPVPNNGDTVTIGIKLATAFGTSAQGCFSNLILRTR